jgi:mono/diheme cytochrome c family protein
MSKRAFTIFGSFAIVFAVVIPFLAIEGKGSPGAAEKPIASSDKAAQDLFRTNCGACHTMVAAGTDGVVGPNLDVLLGSTSEGQSIVDSNCARVLNAIQNGIGGRMPAGILQGENADTVANFVARNVNYFGEAAPASGTPAASSATSSGTEPGGPITATSTNCSTETSSSGSSSSAAASG